MYRNLTKELDNGFAFGALLFLNLDKAIYKNYF